MSHTINVSNSAIQEIDCIVIPNGDWVLADVLTSDALSCFSGAGAVKTTSDLIRIYKTAAMGSWSIDFAKSIGKFFDQNATKIQPGESKVAYSTTMANPLEYFSPSKWGSMFGASTMTLMLKTKDGKQVCTFSSNDDYSWITRDLGAGTCEAVRATYGKLWQPDPKAAQYNFSNVKIANAQGQAFSGF